MRDPYTICHFFYLLLRRKASSYQNCPAMRVCVTKRRIPCKNSFTADLPNLKLAHIQGGSLGNNHRLDQAWIIVFDVADPRAYRPACHLFRRVGREHGLEPPSIGRLLPESSRPGRRAEDHRHAVVKLRAQLVRVRGDKGEAPYPFAGWRAPILPEPGQRHQPAVSQSLHGHT